jgi:DNA-binding response OmpR family regulator
MASDILIVDDEADIRELISGILEDEGHATRLAKDSDETLQAIEERRPSLVILDIWLQGSKLDGLELLDTIKKAHPDLPVIIISGHGNIETAVAAIQRGAYDYIEKPFKVDRLVLITARALEASRLKRENRELRERSTYSFEMIGKSAAINQLRQAIDKVAPTNSRVLITGPSGCGKELAARVMHAKSARADGPFVVLNAAAMVPDRMELELFGTEEGTGSGPRKVGALEEAHGGTLYIDEVADMPLETQAKILRVLVEQRFQRLGGGTKVHVDVRVVSSTSHDLQKEISAGRLREDRARALLRADDFRRLRPATPAHWRGRHGRPPVPRMAGQCPPAPQQRRTPDDPRRRRCRHHRDRRHAARRDRLAGAVIAERGRGRASDVAAFARRPGDLRAGIPPRSSQPLWRQYLADGRVRRHGTFGPPPETSGPGRQLE